MTDGGVSASQRVGPLAKFAGDPQDARQLMEDAKRRKETPYLMPWEQPPPNSAEFERFRCAQSPAC
jgi:hypothetical protein